MADLIVRVAANLTELRKNLEEGAGLIETTRSHLSRMTKSFDGSSIISQAGAVMGAIEKIGDVSMLTAKEQERANAILGAALEKYKALGKDAPAGMQALFDATKKTEQPLNTTDVLLGKIWTGLKSAAGLVGITFTAGAVVNFAGRVFAAASEVDDLSQKLGISAEATQRYRHVASLTGTTLDAFGAAILKMNRGLASGDDSTVSALSRAGLELDTLRAMRPEDAFNAIVDAVQEIPDPMLQTEVAMRLFGKAGAEILPAIREGIAEISSGARVMSDETVKRLADAEDAWAKLGNAVVVYSGEVLASGMSLYEHLTNSVENFASFLANTIQHGHLVATQIALAEQHASELASTQQKATEGAEVGADAHERLAETLAAEARAAQEAEAKAKQLAVAQEELNSAGIGWKGTLEGINEQVRDQVRAYLEAGVSQGALQTVYNLTATQVRAVATALQEERRAAEEAERATERLVRKKKEGLDELVKLEALYQEAVALNSVSQIDIEIAKNDRILAAIVARLNKAGVAEAEYAELVKQLSDEMTKSVMVDTDALREYSRTALEEKARRAEATYRAALASSGEYSAGAIEHFRRLAEEARLSAAAWSTSYDEAGSSVVEKARSVLETVRTYTEQMIASTMPLRDLSEWEVEQMGGVAQMRRRLKEIEAYYAKYPGAAPGGSGLTGLASQDRRGYERLLEMQIEYERIKRYLESLEGRATGGPVEAGRPYVVGDGGRPELFVPRTSGDILPSVPVGGGTTTINVNVYGSVLNTKAELARAVGEAVMRARRNLGYTNPTGA